jgi:NADPH-dependent 2,4-dienoyl-CoA reductase/sulfur reductase-like enzyme
MSVSPKYDVVVVGGGPAGLAAAACAAESGAHPLLIDNNARLGGQIWREGLDDSREVESTNWQQRVRRAGVSILTGVQIVDHPRAGVLLGEDSNGSQVTHYGRLILATGARERFLPFPGWTLPNVFGVGGLQALVKTGLPIRGKRVAIAGTGPLLLAVADHLRKQGAEIVLIAEQASWDNLAIFAFGLLRSPEKLKQAFAIKKQLAGVPYRTSCWPIAARGTDVVQQVDFHGLFGRFTVDCDYLACGFHLVPNTELASLIGCDLLGSFVAVDGLQQTSVKNVYCAGEPTGIGGLDAALCEGQIAGFAAANNEPKARGLSSERQRHRAFTTALERTFPLRSELRQLCTDDTIVCRCEDVTFARLRSESNWRSAKLLTRCGMGPCQGRVCGPITEFLFDWHHESVRPPVFPSRVETMAAAEIEHAKES